jgi:DNA-directed RNA polymerase subunit RPC12/RpoP
MSNARATYLFRLIFLTAAFFGAIVYGPGCKKSAIDQALESDANGYVCRSCKAKFYTDRSVFANQCPNCKSADLLQVVGFVCAADGHVTVGPRGTGSMACEQCGKVTSGLSVPRETDFKAWGAGKKTRAEVGS